MLEKISFECLKTSFLYFFDIKKQQKSPVLSWIFSTKENYYVRLKVLYIVFRSRIEFSNCISGYPEGGGHLGKTGDGYVQAIRVIEFKAPKGLEEKLIDGR